MLVKNASMFCLASLAVRILGSHLGCSATSLMRWILLLSAWIPFDTEAVSVCQCKSDGIGLVLWRSADGSLVLHPHRSHCRLSCGRFARPDAACQLPTICLSGLTVAPATAVWDTGDFIDFMSCGSCCLCHLFTADSYRQYEIVQLIF